MDKKRDSFFMSNKKTQGGGNININSSKKRQNEHIKNRDLKPTETSTNVEKKPFDKKAYRLKKYSKKYKLDQWEEMRKKKLLYNYYKEIKADPVAGTYKPKTFDEDTTDSSQGRFVRHPELVEKENESANTIVKAKTDPYHKAKEEYNKIKEQKLQKKLEVAKAKEERELKLQEYKKKKKERFMKLSKKTKKGQPVLSGRLELLLEEIQTNPKKK